MKHQSQSSAPDAAIPPVDLGVQGSMALPKAEAGSIAGGGKQALGAEHAAFAEFHEGYVGRYIALADAKAGLLLPISTGLLAFHLVQDQSMAIMRARVLNWEFVSLVSVVTLLVLSALFAFLVVVPRLWRGRAGIVFWGDVATRPSATSYIIDVGAFDAQRLTEARLAHCYDVSRVCAGKYRMLRKALIFLALAVGLAGVRLLAFA